MTKQQIERDLIRAMGPGSISMNLSQIAKARHKRREWAVEIMKPYQPLSVGRSTDYLISDVAAAMYEAAGAYKYSHE